MKAAKFRIASGILGGLLLSAAAAFAQVNTAPGEVIYLPQLPTAAELTSAASSQGLTVVKVDAMGSQETVVYSHPDGSTSTVSYEMLPASGSAAPAYGPGSAVPAPATPAPAVAVAPSTSYTYGGPAYDYDYPPAAYYDYGWGPYWYPSLYFGFGGFYGGYYGRGFGGGFRGGGGFHGGGHR